MEAVKCLIEDGVCLLHGNPEVTPDECTTVRVLKEVFRERVAQFTQYGTNDSLEDGTGPEEEWLRGCGVNLDFRTGREIERLFRAQYEYAERTKARGLTWMHLVREEVAEAFAEEDPDRLRAELLQVAALCVSWIVSIDKR